MSQSSDPKREFLRHTLATLAYRAGKVLRQAPPGFAATSICNGARTPVEILAHISDVLDWALSMASGNESWNNSEPLAWEAEVERFFAALERFDSWLASDNLLHASIERLFQGPVADTLTHVGQIALLRRVAEAPVRGENFYAAPIETGQVGGHHARPVAELE